MRGFFSITGIIDKSYIKFLSVWLTMMLLATSICVHPQKAEAVSFSNTQLEYPDISPEQFETLISGAVANGHPYIFGRQADFERIKENAFGRDAVMTDMYQTFKDVATKYVDKSVQKINYDIVNTSYLSRATDALNIILHCAFVYMVEGESASDYADRALSEAMYFAREMTTWGRAQSIDCNHAALGVAICYDWLYDYMSEEERTIVGDAMYSKHLDELYDFFLNPEGEEYKWSFHQAYLGSDNFSVLDNTAVFVEALAVSDKNPAKAATIMSYALRHLTRDNGPFDRLYPDAGWYEGNGYWGYVGPFIARMFSAMESAFGTTFGFENIPYITNTSYFPLYTQSQRNRLIYSDSDYGVTRSSFFYYLGHMSNDVALQKYTIDNRFFTEPTICLWYDPEKLSDASVTLEKDKLFRNIDIATMRSSWDSSQGIFTGMAVQKPGVSHGFMAMGTFALDAFDETWITNPGRESYNVDGYWDSVQNGNRWNYYATRAEANSCVVINPGSGGGQLVDSDDGIEVMQSSESKAYIVSDLSQSYEGVGSYKRGLMMYANRSRVLLQDEISLDETSDVYSFINVYKSDIKIADDGSYAILSKGNKHMYIRIISDKPYKLVTYDACSSALGTSPAPEGQTDFTGDFERLAVRYDDAIGDIRLSVIFVPFLSDEYPEFDEVQAPIESWSLQDDTSKKPVLTSLCVNGASIDGFRGDVNYYRIGVEYPEAKIEATAPGCEVSVKNNYRNNCFDVIVTDNNTGKKNHYCVEYVLNGEVIADTCVGGSISEDSHYLSENYGKEEAVTLRHLDKYMIMAYYKVKLPFVTIGKTIDNVSLILNQYRNTNSENRDSYEFHLVPPDTWEEDSITYNNAPVRHTYSEQWYPYMRKATDGTYSIESTPDMSTGYLNIKTVPKRCSREDRFYSEHTYNITSLVDKMDFANYHREDNVLSYAMGHYVMDKYGSGARTTIASKENRDESLRPRVEVATKVEPTSKGVMAYAAKILSNPVGDELYFSSSCIEDSYAETISAVTYVVNLDKTGSRRLNMYLAQYSFDGELVALTLKEAIISAGEALTLKVDAVEVLEGSTKFKAFVWEDTLTPVTCVG